MPLPGFTQVFADYGRSGKGEVLLRGVGIVPFCPHQMHLCSGSLMV